MQNSKSTTRKKKFKNESVYNIINILSMSRLAKVHWDFNRG